MEKKMEQKMEQKIGWNKGDKVNRVLLVKEGKKGTTRTDKPFVTMKLTTGKDDITGVKWDYDKEDAPGVGTYLFIKAEVDQYNNQPQLVIESLRVAREDEYNVTDFLPSLEAEEIAILTKRFWELVDGINSSYRMLIEDLFANKRIGEKYFIAPAAVTHHHAYLGGLLQHSVAVCERAISLLNSSLVPINKDILVLGALLHDVGKLSCYNYDKPPIMLNTNGKLLDHIIIGSNLISLTYQRTKAQKLIEDEDYLHLQHLLASHHGKMEWGSPVVPKTPEAEILHIADYLDANEFKYIEAFQQAKEGEEWSGWVKGLGKEIWLNNRK